MKKILAVTALTLILGGCSSLASKPPPEVAAPPVGGPPAECIPDAGATPVAEAKSPEPSSPLQEIAGAWVSTDATGPGSGNVRRIEMVFEPGGAFSSAMLVDVEGKKRFSSLQGTWRLEECNLIVTFSDGRTRTWALTWDGAVLLLKEGEAELHLERMPE